jgi:hypothetical protein
MFMPRTLFGEEAQHSGAGRGNGTSRKATQKCLKNASITEKAISMQHNIPQWIN